MADYLNFDEVMKSLEVSEDELRRMVSEGEIRAFRSENKMKFRKEDISSIKKGKEHEPTMILPPAEVGGSEDAGEVELDLEDEAPAEEAEVELEAEPEVEVELEAEPELEPVEEPAAEAEPEMELEPEVEVTEDAPVIEEAPADETFVDAEEEEAIPTLEAEPAAEDSGLDDLTLADDGGEIAEADETQSEDDLDTASTTAPLAFADEKGGGEGEEDTGEGAAEGATAPRGHRAGPVMMVAAAPAKAHWFFTLMLFFASIPCIVLALIQADDYMIRAGFSDKPSDTAHSIYDAFGQKAWEDAQWKDKMSKGLPPGTFTAAEVGATEAAMQTGPGAIKYKIFLPVNAGFGAYKEDTKAKTQ